MLLVFVITRMVDYGIRNGPKKKKKQTNMSIYRNGLRLKTARFYFILFFFNFYTKPYPQERVTEQKKNRILLWGYAAHVDLQYFGFSYSHSRSFRIDKYVRRGKKTKKTKKKACNHTQGGCLCTLAVGHILF